MKLFNLTACFIINCDMNVMITHAVSVMIGEESFICRRTVKLIETFAHVLAMGHHWRCTRKYPSQIFSRQYIIKISTAENDFIIVYLMLFFYVYIIR